MVERARSMAAEVSAIVTDAMVTDADRISGDDRR